MSDPEIWASKSLSPTERLALIRMKQALACPGGRGPRYHRLAPSDLLCCGITAPQAQRLWREFVARGWLREIKISDDGPHHGQSGWMMPQVARYEL